MTTVFRLTGADFSNKGLPNLYPFVGRADLEYGFDFRNRTNRLIDVTGNHTLTPKKVDQVGGIVNVTDQTIISDADGGLGINVTLGYLQSSLAVAPIPVGGAKQFTVMVVGGWSGIAFDGAKMVVAMPNTVSLFEYGANIGVTTGFYIVKTSLTLPGTCYAAIENNAASLSTVPSSVAQKMAMFLTFDGTNWKLFNKTQRTSIAGTNTSLSVAGSPIAVNASNTGGNVSLGGHFYPTSTVFAGIPSLYQQAFWNRVLTDDEIEAQYQLTRRVFAAVGV